METKTIGIFTRTPLHIGCGSSIGTVDQPVIRERHTGFPVIPGSSLKGVLADLWTVKDEEGNYIRENKDGIRLFGNDPDNKEDGARIGSLLIGDGKLLAFPIRSAKGCWAWLTCPLILSRFSRDIKKTFPSIAVDDMGVYAAESLRITDKDVVFEEYPLTVSGNIPVEIIEELKKISTDKVWTDELANHLAIISDDMFAYFAKNACEIANHNRIDDSTGVVKNGALFSQENVPSETMFYGAISSRNSDDLSLLKTKLSEEEDKLQIGAEATTGLGWCSVTLK